MHSLGQERTWSLLVFRASSVFDTTSAFSSKGEMSVWRTWHVYDDATEVFVSLAKRPAIGCGIAAVPDPSETDCYPAWQIQSFNFQSPEKKRAFVLDNGKTAANSECPSPANWNLGDQHAITASYSISHRLHMDKKSGWWDPIFSWHFQSLQRTYEMLIKSVRGTVPPANVANCANLDCSPLCKFSCYHSNNNY